MKTGKSENMIYRIREGLSRNDRISSKLEPSYVSIDGRDTNDFLEFTVKFATLINYYNFNNEIDGTWQSFFSSDVDILINSISKSKIKTTITRYEEISAGMNSTADLAGLTKSLNAAFKLLHEMALLLKTFQETLNQEKNRNSNTVSLYHITDQCSAQIADFVNNFMQAKSAFPSLASLNLNDFEPLHDFQPAQPSAWTVSEDYKEQLKHASEWFTQSFTETRQVLSALLNAATYYEKHHSFDKGAHAPHLALFITFLHLYKYVQSDINNLTEKHLDFYYKDIIRMQPKTGVPDHVQLIFKLAANLKSYEIKAGERLQMELPDLRQKRIYELKESVTISQAQIKELKTQFLSQSKQIYNHDSESYFHDYRLFCQTQPVITPADINKNKPIYSWPLLGEDQNELSERDRTMEDASTGLIIASPILFAADGKRKFDLQIFPTEVSEILLNNYLNNFAETTGYSESVIIHNILDNAFLLQITGNDNWINIDQYELRFTGNTGNKVLHLIFVLDAQIEPTASYRSDVHGGNYSPDTPAIKILLNNAVAYHHPYSFFKDFEIKKISLQTIITGSRQFSLESNFGPLLNSSPFQIFGPVPFEGAYLDVKNSRIFNRYLKSLNLHLRWFALPREKGGFETYYAQYNNDIKNQSFEVLIKDLQSETGDNYVKQDQKYSLFRTFRNDTSQIFLEEETVFENIDCKKLRLKNNVQSEIPSTLNSKDGLRIELSGPPDSFGHRLYPAILPGIVAKNAKKIGREFVMPNTPYVPVLKWLSADYTLQQIQMFSDSEHHQEDNGVRLIHLHPFGFDEIDVNAGAPTFVPQFEESNVLYIGLENIEPLQELSLLFQLDQKAFHHTAHDVGKFQWSYLRQNNWSVFAPGNVLKDSTNNFLVSGIVMLKMPSSIEYNNTVLNPELFWIKAASKGGKTGGTKAIAIITQAATAVQSIVGGINDFHTEGLIAGSTKGFLHKIPEIVKIHQLFPSTGGHEAETKNSFRLRISERLRHKNRTINAHDISQMILEEFPEISTVKCLNRSTTNNLGGQKINLQIVVIPQIITDPVLLQAEPHASLDTLLNIKKFLGTRLSQFARVETGNPVYEKIKVRCTVNFKMAGENTNESFYTNLLNLDISRFISPWMFDTAESIQTGGRIYLSDLFDYLKKLSYVRYISGFSVLHFYRRQNQYTGEYNAVVVNHDLNSSNLLEASRQDGVLFPSAINSLTITSDLKYIDPMVAGVGSLEIGTELTLDEQQSFHQPSAFVENSNFDDDNNLDFSFSF